MNQHLKNQSVAYRPVLAASTAPAKPAAWLAPLTRGARAWCHGFCFCSFSQDRFVSVYHATAPVCKCKYNSFFPDNASGFSQELKNAVACSHKRRKQHKKIWIFSLITLILICCITKIVICHCQSTSRDYSGWTI